MSRGRRICEFVRNSLKDVAVKGAWDGPAALAVVHHALAPVTALPVLEVLRGVHILTDRTLGPGTVVHDDLAKEKETT
jgi:acetoacetate decarboxylase